MMHEVVKMSFMQLKRTLGLTCLILIVQVNAVTLPSKVKLGPGQDGGCQYFRTDFDDPSILAHNVDSLNGQPLVSEEGTGNSWISDGKLNIKVTKAWTNAAGVPVGNGDSIAWTRQLDGPGKVCASIKAAGNPGLVTALMMSSYDTGHDVDQEIDMELVGKSPNHWESNHFFTDFPDYCTSGAHWEGSNLMESFHTYCIERSWDFIAWSIDGVVKRTYYKEDMCDQMWLGAPMSIVLTVWDANGANAQGTTNWAGFTDWNGKSEQSSLLQVDWMEITCGAGTRPGQPGFETLGCGLTPPNPIPGCWRPYWHAAGGGKPSGGGGSGGGSSCSASTWDQCPQTGCCIGGQCQPHVNCFGN